MSPNPTPLHRGETLVRFARAAVVEELGGPRAVRPTGAWAEERTGTFVTLRWTSGHLQGCIGNLEPRRPIADEVAHNAVAAATLDPRAARISLTDVDDLDVELSILSELESICAATEDEALRQIEPGVHGVVFAHRSRRATFLPVVWSSLPDMTSFMGALKEKAGYPPAFWDAEVRLYRYTADKHVDRARDSS